MSAILNVIASSNTRRSSRAFLKLVQPVYKRVPMYEKLP